MNTPATLLQVRGLVREFPAGDGVVADVRASAGDFVEADTVLVALE